jgi:hypothetical protein
MFLRMVDRGMEQLPISLRRWNADSLYDLSAQRRDHRGRQLLLWRRNQTVDKPNVQHEFLLPYVLPGATGWCRGGHRIGMEQ